jgi:hypothetical protein
VRRCLLETPLLRLGERVVFGNDSDVHVLLHL